LKNVDNKCPVILEYEKILNSKKKYSCDIILENVNIKKTLKEKEKLIKEQYERYY
jgi:hypothetical protein